MFFSNHPVTCYEFASHVSLHVKNNMESDSCEVGVRSPQHVPHESPEQHLLASNHNRQSPREEAEKREAEPRGSSAPRANQSFWGDQVQRAGLSPYLPCYSCGHTEGNAVFMFACGTVSPGLPRQHSSFALSPEQVCKASSETVK